MVLTEQEAIAGAAVAYYDNLFGTINSEVMVDKQVLESYLCSKLSMEDGAFLCREVTPLEIKEALFSMNPTKAPRPDGWSAMFYQRSWEVVGPDITRGIQEFFQIGTLPPGINATSLTLCPKTPNADNMAAFRPIACINVLYKIIAKVLATRLQEVLPGIISRNQSAFVKGRSIADNILMAEELIQNYKRQGISSRSAVKIDLKKAFDSVNWEFLFTVMNVLQFPTKFIEWIRVCLSSATFSVSLYGGLFGHFYAKKGVRQGDPFSPYLFTLAMEVLSAMINQSAKQRRIPYHPQCKSIDLTHLCFADDLLIFTEGSAYALMCVKRILGDFYKLSGLQCNPAKCEVFFYGVPAAAKAIALQVTGFREGALPVRYQGIPLIAGQLKSKDCDVLVDRITGRIQSWWANKLSYAGRVQLVSSVLHSMVQYWMTIFILPKQVILQVQKVCSDFLWHGDGHGRAKVRWEIIAQPKSEGGLGLKDLETWNVACSARLVWLLLLRGGSFWVAWIRKYRLKERDFWSIPLTSVGSGIWRKLLKNRTWFQYRMDVNVQGEVTWEGKLLKKFSITQIWQTIRVKQSVVKWRKLLWGKFQVPSYSLITWLVVLDRITTRAKLTSWGVIEDDKCALCGAAAETRGHLFFSCSYSKEVAEGVFSPNHITWPATWEETLDMMCNMVITGGNASVVGALWCWSIAHIWRERCSRVFNGVPKPTETVLGQVKREEKLLAMGNSNFAVEVAQIIDW